MVMFQMIFRNQNLVFNEVSFSPNVLLFFKSPISSFSFIDKNHFSISFLSGNYLITEIKKVQGLFLFFTYFLIFFYLFLILFFLLFFFILFFFIILFFFFIFDFFKIKTEKFILEEILFNQLTHEKNTFFETLNGSFISPHQLFTVLIANSTSKMIRSMLLMLLLQNFNEQKIINFYHNKQKYFFNLFYFIIFLIF